MTHRKDDKIYIGDDIVITVVEVSGGKVKLGFTAPKEVSIVRDKVKERDRGNQVQND
jgi:carbon storage regulator